MSAEKFCALKKFYPAAEAFSEAGQTVVHIPGMKVQTPAGEVEFNALLCPHEHSGYRTRLFTDRQVAAPNAKNWNAHTLCGKTWWTCSWQDVEASLPWIEIVANHLRAFR